MSSKPIRLLGKATLLTRPGRLLEATRILQKALGAPTAGAAPKAATGARTLGSLAGKLAWPGIAKDRRPSAATATRPVSPSTAAARPAPAPATAGSFTTRSYTHEGVTRQYKLFVPTTPTTTPALVVMLHGCTQDAEDFAIGTNMNEFAERDGFVVVYPQQSRDANPSACWNWFNRKDQQREAGEAGFLAGLIRTIVAERNVDPGRVYIAGLSAGGAMAAIVAAEYPELIAAAGIHSGLPAGAAGNLPDALTAMRSGGGRRVASAHASLHAATGLPAVPTIVFHGDADHTVHVSNADDVVAAVLDRAPGATTSTTRVSDGSARRFTRTDHVDASGATLAEHWLLHGSGHAWSGGNARGSYVDSQGIDATAEMVRFFAEHARRSH